VWKPECAVNVVEIKVLSTHAVMEVLSGLGSPFERTSGYRLSITYEPANVIKRQIEDGTAFDVAIVTRPVIDDLATQGAVLPDSRADIGRSGLGVVVRKGAPRPNIGTIEGFKHAVLAAASVVRSKDGTSGLYFETLLDKLGIAQEVRGKIKLGGSGRIAELVANGEAEMAVQQIPELLPVAGVDFVGPLPMELQLYTIFSAGIGSACKELEAAKAFVNFLTEPSAISVFQAKGLEPIYR
jgi:molybdate transport system substrate-binding protein